MTGSRSDPRKPTRREPARYRRLISIDLRHEHCNGRPDRRFNGIEIAPTHHTGLRLARYGMLVRRRPDGLDVLYTSAHADAFRTFLEALHRSFGEDMPANIQNRLFWPPLLFTLRLTDPLFFNYTESPTNALAGNPALWLSNRHLVAADDGETGGKPDPEAGAGGLQSARLTVDWADPKALVVPTDPPVPKIGRHRAKPDSGDPPPNPSEQARELLDHTALARRLKKADPLGEWWFESLGGLDAAKKERTEMKAGFRPRPLPLGFVEIFLAPQAGAYRRAGGAWNGFPLEFHPHDTMPEGAIADADGHVRPSTYEIRFEARRTCWRYLVAGRGRDLNEADLTITGENEDESFERKDRFILPNGATAIRFESKGSLPLMQRPAHKFTLNGLPAAGSSKPRKLVDPLPAPTADLILPDPHPPPEQAKAGASGKVWSEIYVFV